MFIDPVTLFKEGGPFMYAILGLLSVLQVGVVVLLGTLVARLRVPALIWVLLGMLPLGLGFIGTILGSGMALDAIAMASPEYYAPMSAMGLAVSLYTLIAGAYGSAMLFVSFALATGLGLVLRPGKTSRLTGANALIAVLVLVLGSFAALIASGPAPALVVFATCVGLTLAGLRFPEEEERDLRRAAAGRAATAMYGILALGCVSIGSACVSYSLAYSAQARASAETRGMLMGAAMESFTVTHVGIAGLALLLLLATPFVVGPGMKSLDRRAWITAVLTGLCLLPTVGLGAFTGWRISQLMESARPAGEVRREVIGALGVTLPDADPLLAREPFLRGTHVTFGKAGVTIDGKPGDPSMLSGVQGRLVFEARASTALSELAPWAAQASKGFCLAVRTPEFRCIPVHPLPVPSAGQVAGGTPQTRIQWRQDGWALYFSDPADDQETVREDDLEARDLKLALRDVRERFEESAASVWFGPEARVQDYIAFYEAVTERVDEGYGTAELAPQLVWRLDPPEALPEKAIDDEALPADPDEAFAEAGRKVVRRYANQIRYCYERELSKRPDLTGEIEIQVSIGPDGRVINARVARSTLANPQVEQCVVSRFLRMEFMAPPSGGVEVLRLPYAFGTE